MDNKRLNILRNKKQKSAIIFIHGFLGDSNLTWGKFPDLIQKDFLLENWDLYTFGYSTSFLPDIRGIWSCDAELKQLTLLFKTEIETFPLNTYKEIVIIAHSMGGLIVQQAIIKSEALRVKLKCLVMFGTPSRGLKKSIPFNWFKMQLKDLGENSDFIKETREEWDKKFINELNFELCVCSGERDEFVPSSSCLNPFNENVRFVVNGNHLSMVKPDDVNSLSYRLVKDKILGIKESFSAYNIGNVLTELVQFEKAISIFEGKEAALDETSIISYALALEGLGYREKAIKILNDNHRFRTDALGTLAGRFKRLWLNDGVEIFASKSYDLYSLAFELSSKKDNRQQMYYHKINQSFLEKIHFKNEKKAIESASEAKEICTGLKLGLWESATIGEAYLHLDSEKSLDYYRMTVKNKIKPWQIISIYKQAEILCEAYNLTGITENLYNLFTGIKKEEN